MNSQTEATHNHALAAAVQETNGKTYGVLQIQLAQPKTGAFSYIDQSQPMTPPAFAGSVEEFIARHEGNEPLKRQMLNKVKKCPVCAKPNAYTLSTCNACGQDLTSTPVGFTNNVFSGFIYGIQKGPFPFTISLRHQTDDIMVFDDLLALSPCHLNVIPTDVYIPDMRVLLTRPAEGLQIVNKMFDTAWAVARDQFLGNKAWRSKIMNNADSLSEQDLRSHVIAGLNYPPSQYQLHLQFMVPPLFPFHYNMYLHGNHYTPGRFFPVEYIRAVLQLNQPLPDAPLMDIESIIDHFSKLGVRYDQIHQTCYQRYGESIRRFANWSPSDFERVVLDNRVVLDIVDLTPSKQEVNAVKDADKTALQNYGRPYANNRPSGTYYKFAKQPTIPEWWTPSSKGKENE